MFSEWTAEISYDDEYQSEHPQCTYDATLEDFKKILDAKEEASSLYTTYIINYCDPYLCTHSHAFIGAEELYQITKDLDKTKEKDLNDVEYDFCCLYRHRMINDIYVTEYDFFFYFNANILSVRYYYKVSGNKHRRERINYYKLTNEKIESVKTFAETLKDAKELNWE